MKKYYSQKQQRVLENFFIYTLTALASCLICSIPFWFPSMKAFLFVSLSKVGSVLLTPKVLFIVGSLIVGVLLFGESKLFSPDCSPASDVYYDEYISRTRTLQNSSIFEDRKKESEVEKFCKDGEEDQKKVDIKRCVKEKVELEKERPADQELSKRADDFIARVNRKRRLEVEVSK
ncbi:hypothetical protein ACOSQ2_000131 [Xanthoceras sorbifolium]|uniref:DUF4408 domain-containing protein n=1 Tax=Xanthoceras sorbifolium TaxID=99658 RepID=A0ABQ8IPF4_9ROSI|nr:hypothetical protein JRO89_XS01G0398200 [Xanthoceras sorbifolium]